jgi:divalent metal cation (Fe/Co/Zn/Cd) transporter
MALAAQLDRGRLAAIRRVQLLTVLWMSVEVSVSALAAARAHSIAVLAFGGDSAIELLSAVIVLTRFSGTRLSERRAARITAVLLFCLAFFIVNASVLSFLRLCSVPQPAYIGMALLIAAAVIMPWLARRKRRLSAETGSSALAADAAQSSICGWLAWIALAGLGLNAFLGIHWADPLAALAITPIVLKEGRDAWSQKMCHCC